MNGTWEKTACLAYNTKVHISTGQTPFFATFGQEAIVPIHWVYPILCWDERETATNGEEKCSILQANLEPV